MVAWGKEGGKIGRKTRHLVLGFPLGVLLEIHKSVRVQLGKVATGLSTLLQLLGTKRCQWGETGNMGSCEDCEISLRTDRMSLEKSGNGFSCQKSE